MTFSVEQDPNGPVMDIEILLLLDWEITPPVGYSWKLHKESSILFVQVGKC